MTATTRAGQDRDEHRGPALRVEDLRVAYGSTEVVRGVDLVIRPGEKVGIVGESGSGKSTLALAVMGLLAPGGVVGGGSVHLLGHAIDYGDEKGLNRLRGAEMSLVFQDPLTSLDPVKSIGAQIGEVLRRHHPGMRSAAVRARAVELLAGVGVPDPAERLKQYPHEFSGGMRQRVLIAIAIANDPAVLIADEPTTALDVTTQAQVMDLLDSLVDRLGIAVVLVTHDIGLVSEFCDRVLVMYAGRVVEELPTASMFTGSAHPYTGALLDSLPVPGRVRGGELSWIPGAPPALTDLPTGCAFAPRCSWALPVCREGLPPRAVLDVGAGGRHVAECVRAEEVLVARRRAEEDADV